MNRLWCWNLIALSLMLTLSDAAIAASFEDALAAYKRKDYASALSLFRSLAEKGDARALGISVSCTPMGKAWNCPRKNSVRAGTGKRRDAKGGRAQHPT